MKFFLTIIATLLVALLSWFTIEKTHYVRINNTYSYKYINQTNYITLPSPASIGTIHPVIIDADSEVRNSIRE